jgi:hypothetical protein
MDGGIIRSVRANGVDLQGAPLDLRNVDPAIDASAGEWRSGAWFAKLVIQSVAGNQDLVRVCWDAHLPPPPPLTGPSGTTGSVRDQPFKRLMCGVYSKSQPGPDRGGYVSDDLGGTISTYSASW